jgi:hypothetical protein
MPMEIIRSPVGLVAGDVLYISKLVRRGSPDEYWWRAYWIVKETRPNRRQPFAGCVECMVLKMHPDPDKDHQVIDFNEPLEHQVVQYLRPEDYPQGVAAMHMKHVLMGTIKLGD